jgi:predicted protein tyrosine phosphatase
MQQGISSRTNRFSRWLLPLLTILIIFAIVFSALRNNIHVVIPNQVIRSAQLSTTTLNILVRLKGIKTIVNLRGQNQESAWYRQEVLLSKQLNIEHYDIALSSKFAPEQQKLQQLVTIIRTAKKPILFHCESGADRSGLASAIALILLNNVELTNAMQQFSWRYFVIANDSVGKVVFGNYQEWLTNQGLSSNKDTFLKWIYSK